MDEKIRELEQRRAKILEGGGPKRVAAQHDKGKMTARERIEHLLDPGSFTEFDELARHRAHGFEMEATRPYGDGDRISLGAWTVLTVRAE